MSAPLPIINIKSYLQGDEPTGTLAQVKTLQGVTVTSQPKVAKPSFWDGLVKSINSVTGKIQLGKVEAGVQDKTIWMIGAVVIVAVLLLNNRKR